MSDVFAGSRALVTGASSGIGAVFARQLAAAGADLVLAARSGDKLEVLAAELRAAHEVDVVVVPADLGVDGGADRLADALAARGLVIDHLVNNAGFGLGGEFAVADAAREAEMVRLNCLCPVVLARRLLPGMLERRRGGVLNVASVVAFQPLPGMALYGATKAFVLSFTEALWGEVRGRGLRVTALCPGPVPSGFQSAAGVPIGGGLLKLAVLSAETTARRGLAGYARGKRVVVPGFWNKLAACLGSHLPRRLVMASAAGMLHAARRT